MPHKHFLMIAIIPSGAVFVVAFDDRDIDGPKTSKLLKAFQCTVAEQRVN